MLEYSIVKSQSQHHKNNNLKTVTSNQIAAERTDRYILLHCWKFYTMSFSTSFKVLTHIRQSKIDRIDLKFSNTKTSTDYKPLIARANMSAAPSTHHLIEGIKGKKAKTNNARLAPSYIFFNPSLHSHIYRPSTPYSMVFLYIHDGDDYCSAELIYKRKKKIQFFVELDVCENGWWAGWSAAPGNITGDYCKLNSLVLRFLFSVLAEQLLLEAHS